MFLSNRDLLTFVLTIAALSGCGGDDKKKSEGAVGSTDSAVCRRICQKSKVPDCSNDPSDCASKCESLIDDSPADCADERDAYTKCAEKASFTCNTDDESEAKSCSKQLTAWQSCADDDRDDSDEGRDERSDDDTVTGSTGGDGQDEQPVSPAPNDSSPVSPDPDAAVCAERPQEGKCGSCAKSECCESLMACGSECTKRLNCVTACPDQECAEKCLVGADETVSLQTVTVFSCLAKLCDVECTSSTTPDASEPPTMQLPSDCTPATSAASGSCNVPNKANAYECKTQPYDDCVPSPAGDADIWCCGE